MRPALGLLLSIGVAFSTPGVVRAEAARFMGLGFLPGASSFCDLFPLLCTSQANDVSSDGSVVVGYSIGLNGFEAFRWTSDAGMVGLGDLPGGGSFSEARGVSADGSVIVGSSSSQLGASRGEAFRWTQDAGMVGLGDLEGGEFVSIAYGVSADSSVVVGRATGPPIAPQAFRWTEEEGMIALGYLPPPDPPGNSQAYGISADGLTIVGTSENQDRFSEAVRWTAAEGVVGLARPGASVFPGEALAVSADGRVIVGQADLYGQAFRWTEDEGPVGLGDFGGLEGGARAVSADGSVVVGSAILIFTENINRAFIWDSSHGLRDLMDVLEQDFGLDLTGWRLTGATGISADGRTIVGYGENPQGSTEAWIAVLPALMLPVEIDVKPGSSENNPINPLSRGLIPVALLGNESFNTAEADETTLAFGPDGASPVHVGPLADVNGDGWLDLVSHYRTGETGIAGGDDEACLTGETESGNAFEGCDSIRTVGRSCGLGFELALVLGPLAWLRRNRRPT